MIINLTIRASLVSNSYLFHEATGLRVKGGGGIKVEGWRMMDEG